MTRIFETTKCRRCNLETMSKADIRSCGIFEGWTRDKKDPKCLSQLGKGGTRMRAQSKKVRLSKKQKTIGPHGVSSGGSWSSTGRAKGGGYRIKE